MIRRITSYLAYARTSFRDHIRNKARFIARYSAYLFFSFVFIELWRLIYNQHLVNIPYPETDLLWYIAIAQMMLFLSPRLFMVIEEDVRTGNIAAFIIRPLPYLWTRLAEGIGSMTAHAAVYYTVSTPVLYLYIGGMPSHPAMLPLAFIMVYIGSILHLLFQMSTGLLAIWINDSDAVYRIYQKALILLGGLYMPLSLYPEAIQKIAVFTPAPAMMYIPCSVFLGINPSEMLHYGFYVVFWLAFAVMLLQFIFHLALRKIEVNGG